MRSYEWRRDTETRQKHGMSRTLLYRRWVIMIHRCYNINDCRYDRYGGRGIKVCDAWRNNFMNFYNDMSSTFHPDLKLERIDNDGDYTPQNCRWSTAKEQANNRRTNKQFTFNGKTKNITQLAADMGINPKLVARRLRGGYTIEEALTKPRFWRKPS